MEERAAKRLHAALGDLDDLPVDLSDTVAALYYESQWLLDTKSALRARSCWRGFRTKRPGAADDRRNALGRVAFHRPRLSAGIDQKPEQGPNRCLGSLFEMMVGVTNDIIKYRIPAHRMNLITRTIRKAVKRAGSQPSWCLQQNAPAFSRSHGAALDRL